MEVFHRLAGNYIKTTCTTNVIVLHVNRKFIRKPSCIDACYVYAHMCQPFNFPLTPVKGTKACQGLWIIINYVTSFYMTAWVVTLPFYMFSVINWFLSIRSCIHSFNNYYTMWDRFLNKCHRPNSTNTIFL